MDQGKPSESRDRAISEPEAQDVEDRSSPRTPVIYAIVRKYGEDEMARPATSLWWSGFAAGLSISFSLLAQAILQAHLPDAPWRAVVTNFGYCIGFIVVVLSRQQLFTESTITAVLPVLAEFTFGKLVGYADCGASSFSPTLPARFSLRVSSASPRFCRRRRGRRC